LFHAAWAIDLKHLLGIGGYHPIDSGEDQNLLGRMMLSGAQDCDPIELGFDPYCVVWWAREQVEGTAPKLSWLGDGAWEHLAEIPVERVEGPIVPAVPGHFDYANPSILPKVHPIPF
jgi:hypothetical protein